MNVAKYKHNYKIVNAKISSISDKQYNKLCDATILMLDIDNSAQFRTSNTGNYTMISDRQYG